MSKPTNTEQELNDEQVPSKPKEMIPTSKPLPLFFRQFSSKFLAISLTVIIALLLTLALFWQKNQQEQLVIKTQLLPLQQQVKQLESLQQAKFIVDELLLGDSEKNWRKLHNDLIAHNRQLLRLNSEHTSIYRQWLNQNKVASDVIDRAAKNKSRNQQLKQSSVIQLQLMHFSITNISDIKESHEKLLYRQLQIDKSNDSVTLNRATAYVRAVKQSQNVKQLKDLLAEILASFESLTIRTSQADFDLLRLGVEQLFAQAKLVQGDNTKAITEFIQQIDSFRGIVLSEQMALAKWQGYLRLMQSYNLDLLAQKQQIIKLLSDPQAVLQSNNHGMVIQFLANNNIHLTNSEIALILMFSIGLLLVVLFTLLLKVYQQIKVASRQSLALVEQSLQGNEACLSNANCQETQEIIRQIQTLAKPEHNEQDYQGLVSQIQVNEQIINEQKQSLEQLTESSGVQQLEKSDQVAEQFSHELQRYDYLKSNALQQLVQAQASSFIQTETKTKTLSLNGFYNRLEQFQCASYLQSKNAVLTLKDVNFIEVLHCVLLNKQEEQLASNNQLFISYDEQIKPLTNVDTQVLQHLFNLLIDTTLQQCSGGVFHLNMQLQDKNAGQQVIRFVAKVFVPNLTDLPDTIKQFARAGNKTTASSSLVEVFIILLHQLHGEDVETQLIDGGYQLSFEMPLAITSSDHSKRIEDSKEAGNLALAETKVMLLSSNKSVTSIVKKLVLACSGKFEAIVRMDSFLQLISAKHLRRHKLDVLMVTSDIALTELNLIEQQITQLPESLQPKLMVLQSSRLNYQKFGFYQQAEQPLCKAELLQNITHLLAADDKNNQLLSADEFKNQGYISSQLQVLVAVHSPQQYQQLQRLLQWFGLQVQFVCDETSQKAHWKTGRYCLLITEFPETVWLDMLEQPGVPVGVFSLSSSLTLPESTDSIKTSQCSAWHCGQLSSVSSLSELECSLSPWLKKVTPMLSVNNSARNESANIPSERLDDEMLLDSEALEDILVINEVATCLTKETNSESSFDFSRYLQHQGSVELALFMLDDYSQDNHQQLTFLSAAIEGRDIDKAMLAVENLQLNAKILAAEDLQKLCLQWMNLLNDNNGLTELKQVNSLLKDTQQVLHAVDSYAQTI